MDQPNTTRPSLPSISSLIEAVNDQVDGANAKSPKAEKRRRISSGSQGQPTVSLDRPDRPALVESPGNHQPPTPELPPASSFDFSRGTESHASPTSTTPRTSFYPQTPSSTAPELYIQRNSHYPPIPDGSSSYPPLLDPSQWPPPPTQQVRPPVEGPPPDTAQLAPLIAVKADAAVEHNQYAGLAQQRPLPVNFPPPLPGQPLAPIDPQMAPTWQHHHYYPPANPPSYPQTQERYICPTCSKPFSRPSSLKIHTYSHTGEKPYKCKHEGCGKHFSVRSNMKRHEKGCHGGENVSASENSPKDV